MFQLQAAIEVLERYGMIERHLMKGTQKRADCEGGEMSKKFELKIYGHGRGHLMTASAAVRYCLRKIILHRQ